MNLKNSVKIAVMAALLAVICVSAHAAGNSSGYGWSENAGWSNFAPTGAGVTVYADHLEGYAWNENIGWIRLGTFTAGTAHTYANTSNTDYGVNNNGSGVLSGYGWSENAGWINFNPTGGGVTIDGSGNFSGYAWAENIGWINFANTTPAYKVVTTLTSTPTVTAGVSIVSVTNVKATTALAAGTASGTGITERGFFWWNDETYWGDNASGLIPAGGSGAGDFSLTLTGLPVKTQLYIAAYVKIGGQIVTSGNKISITTTDPMLPTVITKPDFTVNGNEVLAKGEITDVGSSPVTIYGFVYAAHSSPTVWDYPALPFTWDMTLPISAGKPFEGTIKNLSAGTYYFRSYAHNSQGTAYGEEYSFTIFGPGFTVAPTGGLVTSESGTTATFTVKLNKQPAADVTVAVSSSDTDEGTVSPASLTFTSENWAVPQTVTLTGVDDTVIDGDRNYTAVLAAAVSDDPVYNGLKPADVSAVNIDNDTPTPTNHAPTANSQTRTTDQDAPLTITLTGSDPDSDTITYAVLTDPQHGTLSGTAPNLTYTPAGGYSGADSFTFRTNDGKLDSVPASISITVNPVGTGTPVYSSSPAPGGTLTMSSYSPANATAILTVTNTGTAVLNITGITSGGASPAKFSVSPDIFPVSIAAGANRVFTVTGNGSTGGTFTATMAVAHNAAGSPANYTLSDVVSVYVAPNYDTGGGGSYTPPNQAPVADRLYVSAEENKPIPVKLTGSDPDSSWFLLLLRPLIYSVLTQPTHGTLSGTAPDLIYTPDTDFTGMDSFTFRIYDGTAYSAESVVAIIVHENSHAYVGDQYELDVFCAEYQSVKYGFRMNFTPVSSDPFGLYWKMDILTFGKAYSTDIKNCIPVGNDLNLNIPSVYFQGTTYEFTLNYNPISGDPMGLYWKMDLGTFKAH